MSGRREFLLFVVVGAAAAALNIGSRLLFSQGMRYEAAVTLAYVVGMLTAFSLNRAFVFRGAGTGDWRRQLFRFLVVNLLALAQVLIVSLLLARLIFPAIGMTFHAETIAHVIAVASPILTSYWAHRHFTFAQARDPVAILEGQ